MQAYRRHVLFYRVMRRLIGPFLKAYFRFTATPAPAVEGPCLVVANHTTDYDSLFVAMSFPRHMYYVASEHIFRVPLLRAFFRYFLDPVLKRKGGADVNTALQAARRLRAGRNVMLFAEGNKSFHGETGPVHPATGGLAKASGATLVTYRLTGGYFTSPRWAHTLRRGRVTGAVMGVYPPQVLAGMTPEAVNALIARDIREDAYARQREAPVRYRGKRLAEGLENALYLCPRCGGMGTLRGDNARLRCACGLDGVYGDTGALSGKGLPFETLTAWGAWQRAELARRAQALPASPDAAANRVENAPASADMPASTRTPRACPPLVWDEAQEIWEVLPDHSVRKVAEGTLTLGPDGLACGAYRLPLNGLEGLEIYGRNTVVFSDGHGGRYQVRSQVERSGLKYFEALALLRGERG